jgi:hypothetical protein
MENLLWAIIPLIISGMAFVTYKHPEIAFKMVTYIGWIGFGVFVLVIAYSFGKNEGLQEARGIIQSTIYKDKSETDLPGSLMSTVDLDSLVKFRDSIVEAYNYKKQYVAVEKQIRDSIYKGFSVIRKDAEDAVTTAAKANVLVMAGCIIFMVLSRVFKNIRKPNSEEQNNSTNQAAD